MEYKKFGIHIKVNDFDKSLDFYLKLGFKPTFCYGDEKLRNRMVNVPNAPEKYNGVTFEVGGSLLEIANGHPAVKPEVFKELIKNSKVSSTIDVNSVEEVKDLAVKYGFNIAKDIIDYPWGSREFVLKDPDGYILVFRVQNYSN